MKKPTSQPNRSTSTMVSFNFTRSQQQAIYRTLTALGLEDATKWPVYLDAIERVVGGALHKAWRNEDEPKLYVQQARKRLVKLHTALNAALQHYERMGGDLQRCLDSELLLDPLLSESLPASAQLTAVQVLSSGRLPLALKSLVNATARCTVSINHHRDLFPKTGAPKNDAFKNAVEGLMVIFEEATGQRPKVYSTAHSDKAYDGNFYEFAVAALRPARLIPGEHLGSNILTSYKDFTGWLYGRQQPRKKRKPRKKKK